MSKEQINTAIAEWMGWKRDGQRFYKNGITAFYPPVFCEAQLPNYYGDLNAVREVEKKLTAKQWHSYISEIEEILERDVSESLRGHRDRHLKHVTAAQCCEALVRTIEKWEKKS